MTSYVNLIIYYFSLLLSGFVEGEIRWGTLSDGEEFVFCLVTYTALRKKEKGIMFCSF